MRFLAGTVLVLSFGSLLPAQQSTEKRTYAIEWRLIRAGTMTLEYGKTHATMRLESSGIVASLFKVEDTYDIDYQDPYCAMSSVFNAKEGKRQRQTHVTYDRSRNRAFYVERDLLKNKVLIEDSVDIPNCASDVLGTLIKLRGINIEPGQSTELPMSDGRRAANVKIKAQEREEVKTPSGNYQTMRYEADLMNGVVYTRKGRVELWLTGDERKLAVQIRIRMSFPVGTVTLQLEKMEQGGKPLASAEASKPIGLSEASKSIGSSEASK
jgi:hypothetical protein